MPISRPKMRPDSLVYPEKHRAGDTLTHQWTNAVVDALRSISSIQVKWPLKLERTTRATILSIDESESNSLVVKTSGIITARSGATYGSGDALIQNDNGTMLVDGATITVRNLIPGAIPSGKYGLVWSVGGKYYLIAEC